MREDITKNILAHCLRPFLCGMTLHMKGLVSLADHHETHCRTLGTRGVTCCPTFSCGQSGAFWLQRRRFKHHHSFPIVLIAFCHTTCAYYLPHCSNIIHFKLRMNVLPFPSRYPTFPILNTCTTFSFRFQSFFQLRMCASYFSFRYISFHVCNACIIFRIWLSSCSYFEYVHHLAGLDFSLFPSRVCVSPCSFRYHFLHVQK